MLLISWSGGSVKINPEIYLSDSLIELFFNIQPMNKAQTIEMGEFGKEISIFFFMWAYIFISNVICDLQYEFIIGRQTTCLCFSKNVNCCKTYFCSLIILMVYH